MTPADHADKAPGWHLKREIQLGHIITTVIVAFSAYGYISTMERRIALLEHQMSLQSSIDDRQDREKREAFEAVQRQLTRLEDKLDRLIEVKR